MSVHLHRNKGTFMKKKRALTLLEIMIVIFLITLITGVIGYNMKGSLDKGKAFKTEQALSQLHDMLLLGLSEGRKMDTILSDTKGVLEELGLARDPEGLLKDGWNEKFVIAANKNKTDFKITSKALEKYNEKKAGRSISVSDESDDE
jgi:general secretion pathway protein G